MFGFKDIFFSDVIFVLQHLENNDHSLTLKFLYHLSVLFRIHNSSLDKLCSDWNLYMLSPFCNVPLQVLSPRCD